MASISFKVHSSCLGWQLWSPTPVAIKPSYVTGTAHHTVLPICTVTKYKGSVCVCVCVCQIFCNQQTILSTPLLLLLLMLHYTC